MQNVNKWLELTVNKEFFIDRNQA